MTETQTQDELERQIADAMAETPDDPDLDPDEDPDETAPPPEQPDPPAPSPTPENMEKRYTAAQRAATAYFKKLGDIFEEQALDLTPCPLCPAIHPGLVNIHDAGRVPEDVKQAAMIFLGFAREQEYEPNPDTSECPRCKGKGKVTTGSRVIGNETAKCGHCRGFGFVPPPNVSANGSGATADLFAPAGERADPLEGADRDPSGEPRILPDGRENPNFGKWPQFKVQVPPYGTTAGLVAQDAAVPA